MMNAKQPKPSSREAAVWLVYDRLLDHEHAVVNVVLAPALPDGSPDFGRADPTNVEALPDDIWPEDRQAEKRACILVDKIDGCDPETSLLMFFSDFDEPFLEQIAGPDHDGDIAKQIIARDIGIKPVVRKPGPIAESFHKLCDDMFPPPKAPPAAANDNNPEARKVFKVVSPADFADAPVPARQWYIEDVIPARNVTLLSGDGGTGKSLLALQIAVAGAIGEDTLGLSPASGRTLVLAAEDEWDEVHRRLADICNAHGKTLLHLRDMRVIPAAGTDAELVRADARGRLQLTDRMEALVDEIISFKPALVVLDTSADLFGGNEIDRNQVRFFISALRGLAMELDCAFLLLSHPSVAGMQSGSGISGSTAWNNSVRSRLYLTADKDDEDARVLKGMKSNYGRKGGEIKMRWQDGNFVLDDGKPTVAAKLLNRRADDKFIELLLAINRNGQRVAPTKGVNYAPAAMAARPDAEGMDKRMLEAAMHRLLAADLIKVVMDGPPSKQRQRLILASQDYGPEA